MNSIFQAALLSMLLFHWTRCCPEKCLCIAETQVLCSKRNLEEIPTNMAYHTELASLSDNRIKKIPSNFFKNLTNLKRLILDNNEIENIEHCAFCGLTGLVELSLQNNPLTVLQSRSFAGLSQVSSLYLGNNAIEIIEPEAFFGSRHIAFISLVGNPLRTLKSGAFFNLTDVGFLSLPTNISSIESYAFGKLSDVTLLQLHGVNSQSLVQDTFKDLTKVSTLSIADCRIDRIQSGAFSGLDDVNYLSIRNCEIQTIDPMSFAGVSNIHVFEMKNNNISDLELGAFSALSGKVHNLNISQNYINCDCRYKSLLDLAENSPNVVVNNTCVQSELADSEDEFMVRVSEDCRPEALVAESGTEVPSKASHMHYGFLASGSFLVLSWVLNSMNVFFGH